MKEKIKKFFREINQGLCSHNGASTEMEYNVNENLRRRVRRCDECGFGKEKFAEAEKFLLERTLTNQAAEQIVWTLEMKALEGGFENTPDFYANRGEIILAGDLESVREGFHKGVLKFLPKNFMASPTEPLEEGVNVIKIINQPS